MNRSFIQFANFINKTLSKQSTQWQNSKAFKALMAALGKRYIEHIDTD